MSATSSRSHGTGSPARNHCPAWCVTRHGLCTGEEDWVHVGEPMAVTDCVNAYLCMSIDPSTGAQDGPYVVIGAQEHTLEAAAALGDSLAALARSALRPPAAASPGG